MRFFAAVAAVVALCAATIQPASADERGRETVLIFGDSTTSQYTDDPGDPIQGWWSMLAEDRGMRPVTSAQAGGGLIKKGYGCSGTSVRERSASVIARVQPDEIWIAVGRNDMYVCIDGQKVKIASAFRGKASAAYFQQLAAIADEAGIPRSRVIVTTLWGQSDASKRKPIVDAYAAGARAAGLTFLNVPRMLKSQTRDTTHPNHAGSVFIYETLAAKMSQARL